MGIEAAHVARAADLRDSVSLDLQGLGRHLSLGPASVRITTAGSASTAAWFRMPGRAGSPLNADRALAIHDAGDGIVRHMDVLGELPGTCAEGFKFLSEETARMDRGKLV